MPDTGRSQACEEEHGRRELPGSASSEQVVAFAIDRLALGSLRIVLVLAIFSALIDTVLAALDGASAALVVVGAAMTGLALAGALRPRRAADLLRPRGRVVLVAALLVLLGVLAPGLQGQYEQMPIACLAAVIASPALVSACVAWSANSFAVYFRPIAFPPTTL